MRLKDIIPYCLNFAQKPGSDFYDIKYRWVINDRIYSIQSFQTYGPSNLLDYGHHYYYDSDIKFSHEQHTDSFVTLNRYKKSDFINHPLTYDKHDAKNDILTLNLNNEITIFDKFIMVHKTDKHTTDSEHDLFFKNNYFITNCDSFSAQMYNIGLYDNGMITNLRSIFTDLINPPVPPKPAELTLDERVDDLIDELMKDSRTMAIKKLKRMLNERL